MHYSYVLVYDQLNRSTSFTVNKSTCVDDKNLMARQDEGICWSMPHFPYFLPPNNIQLVGKAIIAQLQ